MFISNRSSNLNKNIGLFHEQMGGILVTSVTYGIEAFRNENIFFCTFFFQENQFINAALCDIFNHTFYKSYNVLLIFYIKKFLTMHSITKIFIGR